MAYISIIIAGIIIKMFALIVEAVISLCKDKKRTSVLKEVRIFRLLVHTLVLLLQTSRAEKCSCSGGCSPGTSSNIRRTILG